MAHGWNSYYENISPLSSEPRTLRSSESEGSHSQHIENFIGHDDFSSTAVSHEAPATNANYYSGTPSIGNSSSDCVYQRYYRDMPWQADGEQMVKDYLPRCGSNISDFATDGLSSAGPFPFAADVEGLKQDCGMLPTSFLEDYSDVSSCSDADVGETRPSCKFMSSASVVKPKTSVTTKQSEWVYPHTRNMAFSTDSLCPNITDSSDILPSVTDNKAKQNITECSQEKMENPGHDSFSASNMITTTRSETVEGNNDYQHWEQMEVAERQHTQGKYSDLSISGNENLGYGRLEKTPSGNEQITTTASSIFNNEQDQVDRKDGQESSSLGTETFDEEHSHTTDKNTKTDCQLDTLQSSDSLGLSTSKDATYEVRKHSSHKVESCLQLAKHQPFKTIPQSNICISPVISDGHLSDASDNNKQIANNDTESILQAVCSSTDMNPHQEKEWTKTADKTNLQTSSDCSSPIATSDTCDNNDQSDSSSKGLDPCLEKEWTSPGDKTSTTSDRYSNDSGLAVTGDSLCIDTKDNNNKQSVANLSGSCLKTGSSCVEIPSCPENESASLAEINATSSMDLDLSCSAVTGDSLSVDVDKINEESISHNLESCLQPDSVYGDIPCLEKEVADSLRRKCPYPHGHSLHQSPEKTTSFPDEHSLQQTPQNATSSPDEQSLHQSPVIVKLEHVSGVVDENARESFEEFDTSTQEESGLDVLYGEPLSGDDSSYEMNETILDSHQKESSVSKSDHGSISRHGPQLKSSTEMLKHLHPVVILKTLEPVNAVSESYYCAECQHNIHNVDHLIEHHHFHHSVHNFQFCKTCNVYLMNNEQAEKHWCGVTKDGTQFSSDSRKPMKGKRLGRHRCIRCGLTFSKLIHYVKHMRTHTGKTPYKCGACGVYFAQNGCLTRHKRIPGRCKAQTMPKQKVKNSDPIISDTKTPEKDAAPTRPCANLGECYIKLNDISKTHLCSICGKCFLTAVKAKNHFYSMHKVKILAVSSNQCNATIEKPLLKVEHEAREKYKCPLCPRLFKYSYNRARHLRDCVRESICGGKKKIGNKYQCPLCYTTFTIPSNRYRHIKSFCLKQYLNRLAKERTKSTPKLDQANPMQNVLKRQPANEQKAKSKENEPKNQPPTTLKAPKPVPRHKCNLCPAVFCHPSGKYRHMKKHKVFELTGKMFGYKNSVFSTMSKPTNLNKCTKTDKSEDNLTEEKNNLSLSCHFCGKSFGTSQSLKKHERSHQGEKPYRCLECGKGFKKRAYLIGHKITHQRRIQCTVCRKILPSVGELIQHRQSHLKRGMLQCPDCPQQFQFPVYLLRHLDTHKNREEKPTKPEESSPVKPQKILESVEESSEPKQLQCSLCKEVFDDPQILRKHCLTHISGSSRCQCPFCKQNFNSRRYLLRHMIKHTGDKPYSCTNCGKQFYRDLYLKLHRAKCLPTQTRHLVTVDSKTKRPYLCTYCPRTFSKKNRLKSHHSAHKSNSLLLCTKCRQYFGRTKLSQHQRNCGQPSELNTGLSSALGELRKTSSQTTLNVHKMPLQSNSTKMLHFKCLHCSQRFRFRSLYLRHLVSHTGVQPYECMHCGHRYPSQSMCLQHEAFCDGVYKEGQSKVKMDAANKLPSLPSLREAAQKPQAVGEAEYKCKFCTNTFIKSRSLRRHILTHNEVKPYRCKACDSCFSRYDHLKVHQNHCKGKRQRLEVCIPKISFDDVGTGWQNKFGNDPVAKQVTFECKECGRSFPTESRLSRHNTMFHTIKLFNCTRCGTAFAHEKSLKKHKKMRKCRKVTNVTNETNPQSEPVTKPLHGNGSKILRRIQPYFNKKYKYVCSFCPRTFGNSWQLNVHTRLHTGEKPYTCEYCDEKFIRKDYVQRHLPKCTKKGQQNTVLCDRCGGFFTKAKLEDHKKSCTLKASASKLTVSQNQKADSQSPPKGFSCAYCTSRFLLFSQLQEHFLNAHRLETMVPPVSTAPLQDHLSNIPNIKEEPLDQSFDERLSDEANLTCELALDSESSKPFSCSECSMSFVSKAGLMGHQRVHIKEPPFSCKTCKKGFWNKSLLRNHYRKCRFGKTTEMKATELLEGPIKAEIDFALNDTVLLFSEDAKTIGTGLLQTNFSSADDSAEEDMENSEGNQVQSSSCKEKKAVQYQCSECDKSFTDGLLLISHLEDHGREEEEKRRNTCPKCGRVCASQGNLERHMKMHGIDKKFSCPDCSKMVFTKAELEIHRTCHDPNRPYACKLCNQRFWTRPSLCNHYSEDHPNEIFTCRFCKKTYSVKKSLTRHYRKWHQKEQKDLENAVQEKSNAAKQSSSQASTNGESDEEEDNGSEDSDSDSAPYFPCHVCGKTFPTSESLEDHQRCHLGEKPHECAECGKCFYQASQLQQHQRMHKSEFQCQACGRGFVSLFALRKHKHTHGKSRPYRCSKCHLSFTGPSQLAEHMSTHREENFPCDMCDHVFHSKSSRAEHRKSHSQVRAGDSPPPEDHKTSASFSESSSVFMKELKYRCGVCSERFRDPEQLSEHGCVAAKERPYTCSDCNQYFLHASHLKKHRTAHQSWCRREYPCNQCNSSFSSSQRYLGHLKNHDVETAANIDGNTKDGFICPICHQCFASVTELIHHFPMHPDNTFECKLCKMTFPSANMLKEHERRHLTAATEFECTDCGQSFLGSDAFRQHDCSRQHVVMETDDSNPSDKPSPPNYPALGDEEEIDVTGEELYNCPICFMQFYSKSSLLEHQNKQHPNEKPFKCELCGKTFALKRYLRVHERRHRQKWASQSTPKFVRNHFRCTQCHSKFHTAQDLSLHMRLHAEKQVGDHRCDMCYKSFSQLSLLKLHQESHVGQVVYECTECEKAFAFPHLLEEHQQTHAGSSPQ